jgi:hypothetical protein
MIDAPFAHVGGLPVEETLGSFGPALLLGLGVAWARLRARLRRVRSRHRARRPAQEGATRCGRAGRNSNRDDELVANAEHHVANPRSDLIGKLLATPYAICRRWMRLSGTTPRGGPRDGSDADEDLIRLSLGSDIWVLTGSPRRRSSLRGGDGRQQL